MLSLLLENIKIIFHNEYASYMQEATELLGKVDIKDVPFIALALAIQNDGIWSDDRDFESQNEIKIWKTENLVHHLEKER